MASGGRTVSRASVGGGEESKDSGGWGNPWLLASERGDKGLVGGRGIEGYWGWGEGVQ